MLEETLSRSLSLPKGLKGAKSESRKSGMSLSLEESEFEDEKTKIAKCREKRRRIDVPNF
jgi:hypothetical protein